MGLFQLESRDHNLKKKCHIMGYSGSQEKKKCGKNISDTMGYRLVCHSFCYQKWKEHIENTKMAKFEVLII